MNNYNIEMEAYVVFVNGVLKIYKANDAQELQAKLDKEYCSNDKVIFCHLSNFDSYIPK